MEKKVNYYADIIETYDALFRGVYEKANIWPIKDASFGQWILGGEINEAHSEVEYLLECQEDVHDGKYSKTEVEDLRAVAVSAICELLQVIAVCNKYCDVFTDKREQASQEADCDACSHNTQDTCTMTGADVDYPDQCYWYTAVK